MSAVLFNEEVAAHYEEWYKTPKGKRYDRIEKSLLAQALENLRPGTLLEIGCGTGHFARFFAQRGWAVTGIDISLPMIQRASAHGEVPVFYAVADAAQLPFENNTFEVVVLVATLEILENPVGALIEAFRVARRRLVIGFLNRWSLMAFKRRVRGWLKPDLFSRAKFYSAGRIARLIKKACRTRNGKTVEVEQFHSSWARVGKYGLLGTFGVVRVTICPLSPE